MTQRDRVGQTAVVLGAGGLLGKHVVAELLRRNIDVRGFDRAGCALEDERAVQAAVDGATVVYNCAAFTNVDGAERDLAGAFRANALGAENAARAATRAGATLVHVSTDFVFAGRLGRPHDEYDAPEPHSVYGRSKRAGELLIERAAPRAHVVRVQGLYGKGGRNFASRLPELLRAGTPGMRLDDERRVQPTPARLVARGLVDIAASDRFGTWHLACAGETTWYRFALRLAARLGIGVTWERATSATLALPAARPPDCRLDCRRMALASIPLLPSWDQALDEYVAEEVDAR